VDFVTISNASSLHRSEGEKTKGSRAIKWSLSTGNDWLAPFLEIRFLRARGIEVALLCMEMERGRR